VAREHPAHRLADYRGLYARRPAAALAMAFFLLCLAGLPPGLAGLFAKAAVLRGALDAGFPVLAVVTALNVVVALYYYLRWAALLFQRSPAGADPAVPAASARPAVPRALAAAAALCAAAGLAFSGAPQLVLTFASGALL
jgi:NADH-quinone oxidoreductase subunit N